MTAEVTETEVACPACGASGLIPIFETRVPVNVGVLCESRSEAMEAPMGDIALHYCNTCTFVHNPCFEAEKMAFQPGYEGSLVHSSLFMDFINSVAGRLVERYSMMGKTIVEIGCGKGEFLSLICELGGNSGYGFDPAVVTERTEKAGEGRVQFFRDYYGRKYAHLNPDLVCALSMFEDIQQPATFLTELRAIVNNEATVFYFEVFNGARALHELSTWSIHYEQCNYWSEESLSGVFRRSGFEVLDVGSCYGEAEYLYVEARIAAEPQDSPSSYTIPDSYQRLRKHHERLRENWTRRFRDLSAAKRKVVVWGTGGKGLSFLNAFEETPVDAVVDINPNRQGKFIPGTGQEISSPESLIELQPEVVIVTNPLYLSEIKAQVAELGLNCEFLEA